MFQFVTLHSRLLIVWLLLVSVVACSSIREETTRVAEARLTTVKSALLEGTPSDVRFRIASDPLVQSAVIWRGEQRVYPGEQLTHVDDDRLLNQHSRLQRLLNSATDAQWSVFDDTASSLLYCAADALSVCLLLDTAAVARSLDVTPEDLLAEIGGEGGSPWLIPVVLLLSLIAAAAVFWRRRPRPTPATTMPLVTTTAESKLNSGASVDAELPDHCFCMGDMLVDERRQQARRGELSVDITARDLRILRFLHDHPDEVLSKDTLYDAGWGRTFVPGSRALEQHILTLRRKLDPERCLPNLIETVHGQGYRFPSSTLND